MRKTEAPVPATWSPPGARVCAPRASAFPNAGTSGTSLFTKHPRGNRPGHAIRPGRRQTWGNLINIRGEFPRTERPQASAPGGLGSGIGSGALALSAAEPRVHTDEAERESRVEMSLHHLLKSDLRWGVAGLQG